MNYTNLDKIWFKQPTITKAMILDYYSLVAPYFIRHSKQRLMVLERYPDGIDLPSFYQKNSPEYFPDWIKHTSIQLKQGGSQNLLNINNKRSLLYLVNQAALVFHGWQSYADKPDYPNKIVFDLDPATTTTISQLHQAAHIIAQTAIEHGLVPFVMTTGSKGYHVVIPIQAKYSFDRVHACAKQMAQQLADQHPELLTADISKSKRKERIFIDYLRNSYGQTSVSPYSVRALPHAPIAMPITWNELSSSKPQQYTIKNVMQKVTVDGDAWHNFKKSARSLTKLIKNLKN